MLHVEAHMPLAGFAVDVEVSVAPGRCLALAGPSRAGKTSLIARRRRAAPPEHGVVRLNDRTWLDAEAGIDLPPERRRCGVVFLEYALFPQLRAWQNVAYPLHDLPRAERRPRADELLERFGVAARDEVGIVDGGRIVQRGSASALAGALASSFVADSTGAIVLTGIAASGRDEPTGWRSTAAAPS
jgi:molybdate transport system ATP-binding protein